MDEHDLRTLAHDPVAPAEQRRPLEAVLHRSRQLQRRRSAVRAAGAGFLVAGLLGAGSLVRGPGRDHDPGDVATEPPVLPELCPGSMPDEPDLSDVSDPIPAAEAEDLLYLPTVLPPGLEITAASAWRDEVSCGPDPLLTLQTDGGDDTIDGAIALLGPFDGPVGLGNEEYQVETPTRVRGVAATRHTETNSGGHEADPTMLTISWTEANGASWRVDSRGTDEATVRSVVEGLRLDLTGGPGSPPADIPDDAVPEGWEKTWRAPTLSTADEGGPMEWWMVEMGDASVGCNLDVRSASSTEAPVRASAWPGDQLVTVRGQSARRTGDRVLEWTEPDGARVLLFCPGATGSDLVAMAESMEHVSPDDPRLDVPRPEVSRPPVSQHP